MAKIETGCKKKVSFQENAEFLRRRKAPYGRICKMNAVSSLKGNNYTNDLPRR